QDKSFPLCQSRGSKGPTCCTTTPLPHLPDLLHHHTPSPYLTDRCTTTPLPHLPDLLHHHTPSPYLPDLLHHHTPNPPHRPA
ncbi:BUD13 like, partial [Dissostichus eleginoides]